jgi:hypothetical protein
MAYRESGTTRIGLRSARSRATFSDRIDRNSLTPGHGVFGDGRRGIGPLLVGNREQPVELARVEASQAQSEVRSAEFFQLQRE